LTKATLSAISSRSFHIPQNAKSRTDRGRRAAGSAGTYTSTTVPSVICTALKGPEYAVLVLGGDCSDFFAGYSTRLTRLEAGIPASCRAFARPHRSRPSRPPDPCLSPDRPARRALRHRLNLAHRSSALSPPCRGNPRMWRRSLPSVWRALRRQRRVIRIDQRELPAAHRIFRDAQFVVKPVQIRLAEHHADRPRDRPRIRNDRTPRSSPCNTRPKPPRPPSKSPAASSVASKFMARHMSSDATTSPPGELMRMITAFTRTIAAHFLQHAVESARFEPVASASSPRAMVPSPTTNAI
jgi:hypothetical protein